MLRNVVLGVFVIVGLFAASVLFDHPHANATGQGLQTVALIPSDPEFLSVWHADGGRLRRCTLSGTHDYVCGPWR